MFPQPSPYMGGRAAYNRLVGGQPLAFLFKIYVGYHLLGKAFM